MIHYRTNDVETASSLGEITICALRDLALNETTNLHHVLRYWTVCFTHPLLYYLESGEPWANTSFLLHHDDNNHRWFFSRTVDPSGMRGTDGRGEE